MSFDVTVYGPTTDSKEQEELYQQPLGGHGTVTRYWLQPAEHLGLTFLPRLSSGMLTVEHHQLTAFAQELKLLPRHWVTSVPDDASVPGTIAGRDLTTPLLVHLLHRLALLRAAIRIAELSGGHLYISG
ncbi:hypothetical protein OG417_02960 [Actinoallomurus sp. NBC_01490]|uniref:hypothetical protein n=1 Tax=Actinoallomurus sp. NBC_01490 TaxID=2903557 RepID=UPI002E363722|nr:hypothetical protein [Actinoallomurus sp. NBC_01490]